jgi:hypothetical protein
MSPSPIDSELEAVPGLMKAHWNLFTRRAYDLTETKTVPGQATADHVVMTFVNPKNGRSIRIAYYPPYRDMRRSFIVSFRLDGKRVFYLSDYLKAHDREDLEAWLDAEADNPDIAAYWDDFFKKLDTLFNTLLKDIVEGRSWEDVPFDFGDYK